MFSHGLDESLRLGWNISVTEQIQAEDVREITAGGSKVFLRWRIQKEMCTHEVFAPDVAMLKPLFLGPTPLEKPFRPTLNFLKMSEEKDKQHFRPIAWDRTILCYILKQ